MIRREAWFQETAALLDEFQEVLRNLSGSKGDPSLWQRLWDLADRLGMNWYSQAKDKVPLEDWPTVSVRGEMEIESHDNRELTMAREDLHLPEKMKIPELVELARKYFLRYRGYDRRFPNHTTFPLRDVTLLRDLRPRMSPMEVYQDQREHLTAEYRAVADRLMGSIRSSLLLDARAIAVTVDVSVPAVLHAPFLRFLAATGIWH